MQNIKEYISNPQFIHDNQGNPEYVVLKVDEYEQLLEMLEDFGLGQAMLEAENSPRFSKKEALKLLEKTDD